MRFSILHLLIITLVVATLVFWQTYVPKTKWEKMSVHDAIARLKAATEKHHPDVKLELKGLSPARIKQLRKSMPDAPEQLFQLMEHFDFASHQLLDPLTPLPPEEMRAQIQIDYWKDVIGGTLDGWSPDKQLCCKSDQLWRKKWIPIGEMNGEPWFIDMDPAENGIPGQIVSTTTDGFGLSIEAYSLAHLIDRMAEKFELGESPHDEYVIFDYRELPPPR